MERPLRPTSADVVYHVLSRANARKSARPCIWPPLWRHAATQAIKTFYRCLWGGTPRRWPLLSYVETTDVLNAMLKHRTPWREVEAHYAFNQPLD
jgi:hypothetical protein